MTHVYCTFTLASFYCEFLTREVSIVNKESTSLLEPFVYHIDLMEDPKL